jgi:hypothetical protein
MLAITGTGVLVWVIRGLLGHQSGGMVRDRWPEPLPGLADAAERTGSLPLVRTQLVTLVDRMDFPVGFATVCGGCGRDQGSR